MQATADGPAITTTNSDMTLGSPSVEPSVVDVTHELIGERREEWRDGYDSGLRAGCRRVLESPCLESVVAELVLLREVAAKLGAKCDYWMAKADEFELAAEHWHGVAAGKQ